MTAIYSLPSDKAYESTLGVLAAGQRWFSFDVPMDEARRGNATRFGMTFWNFHSVTGTRHFESWAIKRDPTSGVFWYRVSKARDGEISNNRKSLWDALHIAFNMPSPIPMRGILKDMKTRRCAPAYVFDISDVQMQADGSALWLKLDTPGGEVGTEFSEEPLPQMKALDGAEKKAGKRSSVLPEAHYIALRDAAVRVLFGNSSRVKEIQALVVGHGINKSTVEALINNFRCMVQGHQFKAPMRAVGVRLFVDAIISRLGDVVVPKVITAIDGYIDYAEMAWGNRSDEIRRVLAELKAEWELETALQNVVQAIGGTQPPSTSTANSGPSEFLREVWVRGPQHAAFRRDLVRRWKDTCSVHGAACNDQLRASHIVPWSLDEAIRGDVNNGLLLSVPLDCLFDSGLISFDDSGALIAASRLTHDTAQHFGVRPGQRIGWDHLSNEEKQALRINLARHRELHREAGLSTM